MRTVVYARYSSENQREASLEDQIRDCRIFIAAQGRTDCRGALRADQPMHAQQALLRLAGKLVRTFHPAARCPHRGGTRATVQRVVVEQVTVESSNSW